MSLGLSSLVSGLFGGGDAAAPGNLTGGSINIGSKVVGSGSATTTQDTPDAAITGMDWKTLVWPLTIVAVAGLALIGVGIAIFAPRSPRPSPPRKKKG